MLFKFPKILLIPLLISNILNSQEAELKINVSKEIRTLLEIKKELNENEGKIIVQVFSGPRFEAENILKKIKIDFPEMNSVMIYETPNYKIWTKALKSKLEADRELIKIRKKYNQAFYFKTKPKKEEMSKEN
tara:strand:+ start:1330 stop:1725 length:396 start_codon:yes stop_codon:yes gene_type:complete